MEVIIKIFGSEPPCAKCKAIEKIAREISEDFQGKVKIIKLSAPSQEADLYGISITPSIVINDKLIFSGKVPTKEELKQAVIKAMSSKP